MLYFIMNINLNLYIANIYLNENKKFLITNK